MTKIDNYELLKDVYLTVNRVEDKMDKRIVSIEARIDNLEDFKSNLAGKITILGAIVLLVVNFAWDIGKKLLGKE